MKIYYLIQILVIINKIFIYLIGSNIDETPIVRNVDDMDFASNIQRFNDNVKNIAYYGKEAEFIYNQ